MTPDRPTTPMTEPSNEQINTGVPSPGADGQAAAAALDGRSEANAAGHRITVRGTATSTASGTSPSTSRPAGSPP